MYKSLIKGVIPNLKNYGYDEAVELIETIPQIGKEPGVVRSAKILKALGNPEKNLKIIHVAGTNGKGSVCMFITRILREMGYSVGTFVSPHLVKVNERIMIDEEPVDDATFSVAFSRVWEKQSESGMLGYFDVFLAMAMLIYDAKKVDYVVMETGLGGRLDGTNAIEEPILSVITSISLDHCTLLGDTVEQIAAEKAGIIKNGVPVIWDANDSRSSEVIEKRAKQCGTLGKFVEKTQWEIVKVDAKSIDFLVDNSYYKKVSFTINTLASYQPQNATLALSAVNMLMSVPQDVARKALSGFSWKGRMQEIATDVFVDGAHNPDGIRAFLDSVANIRRDDKKNILLFSVVKDKNFESMIREITESELFSRFVVTQLEGSRRLEAEEIKQTFARYSDTEIMVFEDPLRAIDYVCEQAEDNVIFAAGSLYLAGMIEDKFK